MVLISQDLNACLFWPPRILMLILQNFSKYKIIQCLFDGILLVGKPFPFLQMLHKTWMHSLHSIPLRPDREICPGAALVLQIILLVMQGVHFCVVFSWCYFTLAGRWYCFGSKNASHNAAMFHTKQHSGASFYACHFQMSDFFLIALLHVSCGLYCTFMSLKWVFWIYILQSENSGIWQPIQFTNH